jgi:hypothetical protein
MPTVNMTNITLISRGIPDLLKMEGRSPGLHHSTVLRDLLTRMGHYSPPDPYQSQLSKEKENRMVVTRMQLGSAFEEILADRYFRAYPGRYFYPGEMEIDGLPITPDLVDSLEYGPDSIKYTWLSSKHPIDGEKFTYHWMQIKSECIALCSDVGRLHICHNMGDYSYGNDAVHFNVWRQVFDKKDLDNHRTIILRHRDRMLREGWKREGEE